MIKQSAMEKGVYRFSFLSNLSLIRSAEPQDWEVPRAFEVPNGVRFQVINDSLIYKKGYDKYGKLKYTSTLRKTPLSVLKLFKQVPKSYLDYELVGVYNFDHLPKDNWEVYYYSKKRKSLLNVHHVFELNRINHVMVFMDTPQHPFVNFKQFFKVLEGHDATYQYPVMKPDSI